MITWSSRTAKQERVDQADQARRQDRDEDDRDLQLVRREEGRDPAERRARRSFGIGVSPATLRLRTSRRPLPAAESPATAGGTARRRPVCPRGMPAGPGAAARERHQAVAVRGFGDPLGLEPALGVDGGLAAVRGGRDGLPVAMIVDVAGDEHAVDLGAGLVVDDQVALLVDVEPVPERLRVRP